MTEIAQPVTRALRRPGRAKIKELAKAINRGINIYNHLNDLVHGMEAKPPANHADLNSFAVLLEEAVPELRASVEVLASALRAQSLYEGSKGKK